MNRAEAQYMLDRKGHILIESTGNSIDDTLVIGRRSGRITIECKGVRNGLSWSGATGKPMFEYDRQPGQEQCDIVFRNLTLSGDPQKFLSIKNAGSAPRSLVIENCRMFGGRTDLGYAIDNTHSGASYFISIRDSVSWDGGFIRWKSNTDSMCCKSVILENVYQRLNEDAAIGPSYDFEWVGGIIGRMVMSEGTFALAPVLDAAGYDGPLLLRLKNMGPGCSIKNTYHEMFKYSGTAQDTRRNHFVVDTASTAPMLHFVETDDFIIKQRVFGSNTNQNNPLVLLTQGTGSNPDTSKNLFCGKALWIVFGSDFFSTNAGFDSFRSETSGYYSKSFESSSANNSGGRVPYDFSKSNPADNIYGDPIRTVGKLMYNKFLNEEGYKGTQVYGIDGSLTEQPTRSSIINGTVPLP